LFYFFSVHGLLLADTPFSLCHPLIRGHFVSPSPFFHDPIRKSCFPYRGRFSQLRFSGRLTGLGFPLLSHHGVPLSLLLRFPKPTHCAQPTCEAVHLFFLSLLWKGQRLLGCPKNTLPTCRCEPWFTFANLFSRSLPLRCTHPRVWTWFFVVAAYFHASPEGALHPLFLRGFPLVPTFSCFQAL